MTVKKTVIVLVLPPVSSGIPFKANEAVTAILGSCSCSHRQASDVLDKGNCIKAYFSLFTQCAFDAYGLRLCRDMKFSNFPQSNNLPQAAVRNASHVIWGHCCWNLWQWTGIFQHFQDKLINLSWQLNRSENTHRGSITLSGWLLVVPAKLRCFAYVK